MADGIPVLNLNEKIELTFFGEHVFTPESKAKFTLHGVWAVHLYFYTGRLKIGEEWHEIHPGTLSFTPPDIPSEYIYPEQGYHMGLHMKCGEASGELVYKVPPVIRLGKHLAPFRKRHLEAFQHYRRSRFRCEIKVWDLLLDTLEKFLGRPGETHYHPLVENVLQRIHADMAEPFRLDELSKELLVSKTHINRVFNQELGMTVMSYVRRVRLQRAKYLLEHTTMPIKSIAGQVGIPDQHVLNKNIRQMFGQSPSAIRKDRQ